MIGLLLEDPVEKSSAEGTAATTGKAFPFRCLLRPDLRRVPMSRSVNNTKDEKLDLIKCYERQSMLRFLPARAISAFISRITSMV